MYNGCEQPSIMFGQIGQASEYRCNNQSFNTESIDTRRHKDISPEIRLLMNKVYEMSLVNRSLYYDNFDDLSYKEMLPKLLNEGQWIEDFPILAIYYIIGKAPEYMVKRWSWIYSNVTDNIGNSYKIDILHDTINPKTILLSINNKLKYKINRMFENIDKHNDLYYVKDYEVNVWNKIDPKDRIFQLSPLNNSGVNQNFIEENNNNLHESNIEKPFENKHKTSISYIKILPQGPLIVRKEYYDNNKLNIVTTTTDKGTIHKSIGSVYQEFLEKNPNILASESLFDSEYRKLLQINKLKNQTYESIWNYYRNPNKKFIEKWTLSVCDKGSK